MQHAPSLDATPGSRDTGPALLAAVEEALRQTDRHRLWLVTTTAYAGSLWFSQRRAHRLAALFPAAVDEARAVGPAISTVGLSGIPIRDDLVFQKRP